MVRDKDSGAIVDANHIAYKSYGLTSLEVLQAKEFWTVPPYSADDALQWIHKVANEGAVRFEWKNRRVNGEVFWEHVTLRIVFIGCVERILFVAIDITERKKAERLAFEKMLLNA